MIKLFMMISEYRADEAVTSIKSGEISHQSLETVQGRLSENSIVIEPAGFMSALDFRTFWDYRELIYFLALRDLKIRYKQTLVGIVWVLLQPILTTLIFTAIFLRLGRSDDLPIPYALFAFSGFVLWTFINAAIANSSNSLINHSALITKVFFPRLVIPLSAVGATLVDLAVGLVSLFVTMLIYGVSLRWELLLLPLVILPTLFLAIGFGTLLAALNVKYRDVKYVLPFVLQLLLFISPVFYSLGMLSEGSTWIWQFNPLTGVLENFRALLFGLPFDFFSYAVSVSVSLVVFFLAVYVFHRMEDSFADVI